MASNSSVTGRVHGSWSLLWIAALGFSASLESTALAQCGGMSVIPANNVDISKQAGNEAEPAISIDPTNIQRLWAFSNPSSGSNLFAAYSTNGGTTWTKKVASFPASDGLTNACCDPSCAWDSFGNLFISYINGSVNAIIVALSTNGGVTFTQLASFSGSVDQETIVTGPGSTSPGSVWVCYNLSGTMVARGATVSGLGTVGAFTAAASMPSSSGSFGDIAIGPAGQVMLVYGPNSGQGPGNIYCNTDPDGLGPSPFGARVTITGTNVGGFDFIPAQSGRSIDPESGLAWDRSGGPHNGRVYCVYTDETVDENNDTEIRCRYSDNNGSTWTNFVRVNDDATTRGQFNPRIAMDQTTGIFSVAWMDCRNSAGNNTAQNWATISTDYGASFLANVQVSAGTSNAATAGSGVDYGDYNGLTMHGGVFYPIWADNSGAATLPGYVGSPAFDLATNKVTITVGPNTPTGPTATPSTICAGQASALSATPGAGETIDWYTGGCPGTLVPGGANPTVTPAANTTYSARARNTTSGCTSSSCANVTVTVNPLPAAPSSPTASPARICLGQSSTLSASVGANQTVDWSSIRCIGGVAVPGGANPTVSPTATTTYFARAHNTLTGCLSTTCTIVVVALADHTGDFDGGGVGDSDLNPFVNILLTPGTPQDCIADVNADGVADALDIGPWVHLYAP